MFFVNLLVFFISLLVLFYGCIKIKEWLKLRSIINKIPGFPDYPVIGNLGQVFGRTPEEIFVGFRENAKILVKDTNEHIGRFWVSYVPTVNMWAPQDIQLVTSNASHNKKSFLYTCLHAWLGTGLLTSTGDKWQHRRKILTPTFHFNILKSFFPAMVDGTNELVEILKQECDKEETDVIPLITKFALKTVCETAMGIKLSSSDSDRQYVKNVHGIGNCVIRRFQNPWIIPDITFVFSPTYWEQKTLAKDVHKFSQNVIDTRRKTLKEMSFETNDDSSGSEKKRLAMLDMLLTAQSEGVDIDDEGIREEVDTFMFGGHDTTSISICFTLMLLANNRDCQDKIYEEIETILGNSDRDPTFADLQEFQYTERCIKESLRLYPSVPMISRICGEQFTTHEGYVIPKGVTINMFIYDMQRHPDFFPDPEKFDPDRFLPEKSIKRHPFAFLPYSAGSRNCIGQKYAQLEQKTAIIGIIKNFILKPVDTPESVVLISDIILRAKDHIKVKFVSRK